ncbi:MAG TPA: hypothetical protein VJP77_05765 [Planctomycetota bacterium]|nr:hypothetical protein [Planctomycetota bacterium]
MKRKVHVPWPLRVLALPLIASAFAVLAVFVILAGCAAFLVNGEFDLETK